MNTPRLLANPILLTLAVLLVLMTAFPTAAVPPRGSAAPGISLKNLKGELVSTAAMAPKPLVLIFGEVTNEGTRHACADVLDILKDPRVGEGAVAAVLVTAQQVDEALLKEFGGAGKLPDTILHDPEREGFGAYRVLTIPTVVVVDGGGRVVYAAPAYQPKTRDILSEAVLVAVGKETPEQFARSLEPTAAGPDHEALRADRLVHLATELTKHELYDMAEARYSEALAIVPGHTGATVGMGELMLKRNRIDRAEELFRSVLAADPASIEATLGIAAVELQRGGDGLAKASTTLKAVIEKNPRNARARFMMGVLNEKRGEYPAAMAEFKISAELLLDR